MSKPLYFSDDCAGSAARIRQRSKRSQQRQPQRGRRQRRPLRESPIPAQARQRKGRVLHQSLWLRPASPARSPGTGCSPGRVQPRPRRGAARRQWPSGVSPCTMVVLRKTGSCWNCRRAARCQGRAVHCPLGLRCKTGTDIMMSSHFLLAVPFLR